MGKRQGGKKWFRSFGQSLHDRGFTLGEMNILTDGCVGKSAGAIRYGWVHSFLRKPKTMKGGA